MTGQEICSVVFQIAAALNFIHKKGYVHRDVKPENISLADQTDFRLLKFTSFLTARKKEESEEKFSGSFGSYVYMAPEMLNDRKYDESVDIWALGILTYILVTH